MNDLLTNWSRQEPLLQRAFDAGAVAHVTEVLGRLRGVVEHGVEEAEGYETEVADVVDDMRAHMPWFEAYALVHDAAWPDVLHDKKLHAPEFEALVKRVCLSLGEDEHGAIALHALAVRHLDARHDFSRVDVTRIRVYHAVAKQVGWDEDAFLVRLHGVLLIDTVDETFERALASLDAYDPGRRARRAKLRAQIEKQRRNDKMRSVGLDGDSLLTLLKRRPSPEFGKLLQEIQSAVTEHRSLPFIDPETDRELQRRAIQYQAQTL
jgi:hypothetical protein